MFGPFRSGDLVAQTFGAVKSGSFILYKEGLYLAAFWPATGHTRKADVPVLINPQGMPTVLPAWHPAEECVQIAGGQLELSLSGITSAASKGQIGLHLNGNIALSVQDDAGATAYIELATGALSIRPPAGYVWAMSWHLELVLGDRDRRLSLGQSAQV